ncbi:hypothetical protein AVEN_59909-1 [Araneus ventricosus]|uniref:HTH CENPB-type domain-containing protein n=1 Tax=Araneus ventricosus TaxID=182803 RepID=A0A4Y2EHA0_ARAVE|nr:hypothetical protein AVEN_59909-1 [Araneus ventricosus]
MAIHKKNVLDIGTKMEIIKEKDNLSAKQIKDIAEKLGKTDSHASNGWLETFRKRHGISFKAVCGVAGDSLDETVNTWIKKLKNSLKALNLKILRMPMKVGLFFVTYQQNLHVLKKQSVLMVKRSKERLVVLFCAFMTGEIKKLLVIGNAAKASVL